MAYFVILCVNIMSNASHAYMLCPRMYFSTWVDHLQSPEFGKFVMVKTLDGTDDNGD